ncbi:hypothetical protein MRX96_008912 [Rhipicephalus microplus]
MNPWLIVRKVLGDIARTTLPGVRNDRAKLSATDGSRSLKNLLPEPGDRACWACMLFAGGHLANACPTRTFTGPARARPCVTRPAGVKGWVYEFTKWHASLCHSRSMLMAHSNSTPPMCVRQRRHSRCAVPPLDVN